MFKFHQIHTLADARALPPGTIGIEIVDREMAQAILDAGGSNLDGQHGVPAGLQGTILPEFAGYAAVDIARIPLVQAYFFSYNPARDTLHFAFQRPDLDACAAAAVLVLRALELIPRDETDIRTRIALIARADSFRTDGLRWEDWAPPAPTLECPFSASQYTTVDGSGELAGIAAICSPNPRTGQPELPLGERVAITAMWLLWGTRMQGANAPPAAAINGACGLGATAKYRWRDGAGDEHEAIFEHGPGDASAALERSHRMVIHARLSLVRESSVERREGIAIVRSAHAGVSAIGYSRDRGAPVFVAIPPHYAPDPFHDLDAYRAHVGTTASPTGRKVTIATCSAQYLDVPALTAALNAAEQAAGGAPKWGGPASMCCSPMTEGTVLDDKTIIAAVCAARRVP